MENIQTLTQLLKTVIVNIKSSTLADASKRSIHNCSPMLKRSVPYPYPMQRKAHLAIAYWNEQKQPWIWF